MAAKGLRGLKIIRGLIPLQEGWVQISRPGWEKDVPIRGRCPYCSRHINYPKGEPRTPEFEAEELRFAKELAEHPCAHTRVPSPAEESLLQAERNNQARFGPEFWELMQQEP